MQPAGHKVNGFGRQYLHEWEARLLYEAKYMALSDFRCPGTWRLSAGGIPIPSVPHGAARQASIHQHYYEVLTPEERNDLLWDPNNEDQWTAFFTECHLAELAHYEGNGPPLPNKNAAMRKVWWGIEGRTLLFVLDHIAVGNYPRLTMPQRQHWLPCRMDGPVLWSLRSSSSTPRTSRSSVIVIGSPPSVSTHLLRPKELGPGMSSAWVKEPGPFTRVKKEPGSFSHVKKEHGMPASPSSKKARWLTGDTARQLAYQAPDDSEEFPSQRAVERASFNKVQLGTLEFALAWSRQGAKRAEAEHVRCLSLCVIP
jgi:hypothetical protein